MYGATEWSSIVSFCSSSKPFVNIAWKYGLLADSTARWAYKTYCNISHYIQSQKQKHIIIKIFSISLYSSMFSMHSLLIVIIYTEHISTNVFQCFSITEKCMITWVMCLTKISNLLWNLTDFKFCLQTSLQKRHPFYMMSNHMAATISFPSSEITSGLFTTYTNNTDMSTHTIVLIKQC